jgi:hypothetical protein
MAVQVLYNGAILVNAVDLSSRCKKLKVNFGQETKETTAMGDVARHFIVGLATPSCDAEFYIDRASGSVVQTLRALVGITVAPFPINVRFANSAATTSNEVYTMNAVINGGIDVISGSVGDVEAMPVKFACGSGTGWTVATTS